MKRLSFILLLTLLTATCLLSYTYAQPEGYETWRDSALGITVTYPETWTIDERPETLNVPCVIEAPESESSDSSDYFGAFVMPVRIGEGYFSDVTSLKNVWLETVEDDWVNVEVNSNKTLESPQGYPVYEVDYIVTDQDDNRIRWLVWLVLTRERKIAWVAAYCLKADDPPDISTDEFKMLHHEAYGILLSMEFDD
jgi:hypothetical protein